MNDFIRETNQMTIIVHDFYALKRVNFTINPGINIIAGKNGSGKSQLLMALAHQYGNQTLNQNGYDRISEKTVLIDPKPRKVLWRQPIRNVGAGTKGSKFATLAPPSYATRNDQYGYTWGVDERYNNLHNSLTNMYVAGNLTQSSKIDAENWVKITSSFQRVFGKEFNGEYTSSGGRVGIKLDNGELGRFDTLSTGELELLSLFCDVLTEPEVDLFIIDEIDAHFHPNLQKCLIIELETIANGRNILLTTHSPSLMLSVPPSNLFYLRHFSEVEAEANQMKCLAEDIQLIDSIAEMYSGFVSDIRIGKHYFESFNHELLLYASDCLKDSTAIGSEKASESDPQTSILRALLLAHESEITVEEVGVGKGRLLAAFKSISEDQLANINYIGIDIKDENLEELDKYAEYLGLKSKFKSFRCSKSIGNNNADICILANIIHEVGPDSLPDFLNSIFLSLKNDSKILILEALELPVGEKRFVLFDETSLTQILKSNIEASKIKVNFATPQSHNGTPLLEGVIHVKNESAITVGYPDIIHGLSCLIEKHSQNLVSTLDGTVDIKAKKLAFICHNLANANAYIRKLESY